MGTISIRAKKTQSTNSPRWRMEVRFPTEYIRNEQNHDGGTFPYQMLVLERQGTQISRLSLPSMPQYSFQSHIFFEFVHFPVTSMPLSGISSHACSPRVLVIGQSA